MLDRLTWVKMYIDDNYLKSNKIIDEVKQYYDDFFSVKKLDGKQIKQISQEYVDGLVWVFDHYYGELDRSVVSPWYFKYNKAPLMTQIYDVIKNHNSDYFINISKKLKKQKVSRKDYFNTIEQLMYVTPAKGLDDIMPEEYQKFINSGYYPDLDKLAKEFINGKDIIDCRGEIFLNKCHLDEQNKMSDKQFINTLRKIKIKPKIAERSGTFYEKPRDKIFNYGIIVPLNSLINHDKYKYYKQKYLETGYIQYKIKYKYYKNKTEAL